MRPSAGGLQRLVRRPGIDDHDFITPGQRIEATANIVLLVQTNDSRGKSEVETGGAGSADAVSRGAIASRIGRPRDKNIAENVYSGGSVVGQDQQLRTIHLAYGRHSCQLRILARETPYPVPVSCIPLTSPISARTSGLFLVIRQH